MNSSIFYTPEFLMPYAAGWMSFCLVASLLALVTRRRLLTELTDYGRFLSVRWKLLTFLPAFLFVTFAGRLTNDPNWDMICGGGMALLTFATAPWSVGAVVQVMSGRRPESDAVIALALWLFASSWYFDGYLFLRNGHYTDYWLGNLLISPFIYLAAGLLWNLEARTGSGGVRFGFMRADWPEAPADHRFRPVFAVSIPLVVLAAYLLVAYVEWPGLKPLGFK